MATKRGKSIKESGSKKQKHSQTETRSSLPIEKNLEETESASTYGKLTVVALVVIVLLSLWPRLYRVKLPIMVYHSWRQCDTAAIARNIYRSGLDIFHPRVDYNGADPSTVECEFQIYGFITACFYAIFGVKEAIGRLVSTFFYVMATIPMAYLGRRLLGKTGDIWTLFFFGISPVGIILSRSFQPDSTMLFFMVTSVACFWHYLTISSPVKGSHKRIFSESGNNNSKAVNTDRPANYTSIFLNPKTWLIISGVSLGLSLLTKLVAAYIGIVFLGLTLSYRGLKGLTQKDIWSTAAMGLLPSVGWYYYAHSFPVSFNIWGLGPQNLSNWTGWATSRFYEAFKQHFIGLSLTEYVFWLAITGIGGIALFERKAGRVLALSWIIGGLIYQTLTAKHFAAHSYYYYPVVPIFVLCGAWLPSKVFQYFQKRGFGKGIFILLLLLLTGLVVPRTYHFLFPHMYEITEHPARMLKLAKLIKKTTESDDLIITAVGHGLPEVLYYADRRGWNIGYKQATIKNLRKYVKRGATHFAWLQPIVPGYRPSAKSKITLWPLVEFIYQNEIECNYCIGAGYGFNIVVNLTKSLKQDLNEQDNICRRVSEAVNTCIRTGNNIESITSKTGINCFILPWEDLGNEKYGIIKKLFKNDLWKLVYFNDHGVVFLKAEGPLREIAFNKAYSYIDPWNRYGNFCQLKTVDSLSLENALTEAQRAHEAEPKSWRAATVYGALLERNNENHKAIELVDTPYFKKYYPLLSRVNHLICARNLNDRPQIARLVNEILDKWPDNKTALHAKKEFNIP